MIITEERLRALKWTRRVLNDIIPEYYQAFDKAKLYGIPEYRLVVRFNEFKGEREIGRVYLYVARCIYQIEKIKTMEQLVKLSEALRGQ